MAGDSAVSTDCGLKHKVGEPKVFRAGAFAIGDCGDYAYGVLLRKKLRWPSDVKDVEEYMYVTLPDEIRDVCKRDGIEIPDGGALIGCGGILWELGGACAERRAEDYAAIGSGASIALGALCATQGRAPRRRLLAALEAAERHRVDVASPWDFVTL
jgi:hypothetical protein